MAAIKIAKFLGEAPKISPELLPDSAAQLAVNLKLYSGDLISYRYPELVGNTARIGENKTIYALRHPDTDELVWLSWPGDVDVVLASATDDGEQRFYYTGDGGPKVSTYALATSAGAPYPNVSYDLGLPLPTTALVCSASSFPTKTTASRARDAGNYATVVTGSAHGLRTGMIVTVSGFPAATPTVATFNAANAEVMVVNATTFTYFSPGEQVTTTADTAGSVALAGATFPRSYVFTWYTSWDEESIASAPSDTIYIKEGQTVQVTGIPHTRPAGNNAISGVRIYRTLATPAGTEYFRLATLWFPINTDKVARTANVARLTTRVRHNLGVGDRFKIVGCLDSTFNVSDGVVTAVDDLYSFKYANTGANVAEKSETVGTIYYDCAENLSTPPRYWGYGGYQFTDDFDTKSLTSILGTDDYDPPPEGLRGLVTMQGGALCGFVGNTLYFSVPGVPHAWPAKYARTLDTDIVGVAAVSGFLLVLTESYPYHFSGTHPENLADARIDVLYPCVSKRSIVNMGYGVAYATHGGVAVYSPTAAADLVTKFVHDWDTWEGMLDPSTIVAEFFNGKYFATHSTGGFIFERDDRVGGVFVRINYLFSAAWLDSKTNRFYYTSGDAGGIFEWDKKTQPLAQMEWKSKVITTKGYINLGAARVIADYGASPSEVQVVQDYNATVGAYNTLVWASNAQLGCLNSPGDPLNLDTFSTFPVNGDPFTRGMLPLPVVFPITFKLWCDKELVAEVSVADTEIFRLPPGFQSSTFEIGVSGAARVRAIHIGETPYGLREA